MKGRRVSRFGAFFREYAFSAFGIHAAKPRLFSKGGEKCRSGCHLVLSPLSNSVLVSETNYHVRKKSRFF